VQVAAMRSSGSQRATANRVSTAQGAG